MGVLKIIFMVVAIISIPLVAVFLIRLVLKASLGISHINKTLDDARPQINALLININHTMEDINEELGKIGRMTNEAQDVIQRSEESLGYLEDAMRSPLARYGGMLAGFLTTTLLMRSILRRSERTGSKNRG